MRLGKPVPIGFERPAPTPRGSGRKLIAAALLEPRQRLQLHLGVAAARKQPAGIAIAPAFGSKRLLAQLVANQARGGAKLLQVFASTVDGGREVAVAGFRELFQHLLGATERDSAHPLPRALLPLQPVGPAQSSISTRHHDAYPVPVAGPASRVLSSSQLATLAEHGEERTAEVGEKLFEVGDETYPFIAILEGEVAVARRRRPARSSATAPPASSAR